MKFYIEIRKGIELKLIKTETFDNMKQAFKRGSQLSRKNRKNCNISIDLWIKRDNSRYLDLIQFSAYSWGTQNYICVFERNGNIGEIYNY